MRTRENLTRRRRARLTCVLALTTLAVGHLGAGASSAQATPLAFGGCGASQVTVPAAAVQCATLRVPLDRADPAAGSVALAVQRVAPSGPRLGVVVLLAGGPGQAAIPPFEEFIAPLSRTPQLRGFELVAFDQRGTGESGALSCESGVGPAAAEESFITTCGEALGATRADYTSQESVEDLDALRLALGGGPLSILSVSYGGRVAGMYAHEHPADVARMVLDSPTGMAGDDALDTQRLRALPRVLDQGICGGGACRSFTADEYADLVRVVARLRGGPLRAHVYDAHGRRVLAAVSQTGLLRLLARLDTPGWFPRIVPAAISAAARGDTAPLARLVAGGFRSEEHSGGISAGLYLATYCDENPMPWAASSELAGRPATLKAWLAGVPAASTVPFAPAAAAAIAPLGLCLQWPATPPAPAPPGGVSPTPTLILSGADDLRTPLEQSLSIAAGYSDVRLLRIPATGHSTISTNVDGCALIAAVDFLSSGQSPNVCPTPAAPTALALPPASLAAVHAAGAAHALPSRAATAAALTLDDALGQPASAGGGLRGGSWALHGRRLVLERIVDVGGVSLTGTIMLSSASSGRITIGGRVRGTLQARGSAVAGITLTGRLDGARVRARVLGA